MKQTSEFDQTFGTYMGDSISKTLGPPTPLLPDPNPLPLAEESGGVQPMQKVTVFFGKKKVALLGLVEKREVSDSHVVHFITVRTVLPLPRSASNFEVCFKRCRLIACFKRYLLVTYRI